MSKIETARALSASASGPQLQVVQAIQQLQQMLDELKSLPEAVASETSQALSVLETLRQDVGKVLAVYEQVTKHQRDSLDELTTEMTKKAAEAFETKVQNLHTPLGALEGKASELATAIKELTKPAKQIAELPQKLRTATANLETASTALERAALNVQPPLWKRLTMLAGVAVLAGAVGAVLAGTGQAVSVRLVPPSAEQQELANFRALWRRMTPKERESMQEIANRPAK